MPDNSSIQQNDADVIVIGGGPIGLVNALGIKKLNPTLRVVVLEKYEEYQRSHNLIMEHKKLAAFIQAISAENDPVLSELLNKLQQKPHIRTNELEKILKELAMANGVKMIVEEVKVETFHEQIKKHSKNPRLIVGADGTHSTVSKALFPADNQVKHDFDYVLQMRYEVLGEKKAEDVSAINFYQMMARNGLIANEYVGRFSDGKTPVTMQMMISKEYFEELKAATSKNPIMPFMETEFPLKEVPEKLNNFLQHYLIMRMKASHKDKLQVDEKSIRISVNEAPATHAKQIFTYNGNVPVVLVGDAGLGLSYFKGLNAGIEASAKLLSTLKPAIKKGLNDQANVKENFQQYQQWFIKNFAPKKIREVANYSTWRIRALWNTIKVASILKQSSLTDEVNPSQEELLRDYFNLLAKDPFSNLGEGLRLYPHRDYDLVKGGQFAYVPPLHSWIKIKKIFADLVKPYKSKAQVLQDFKQLSIGLSHLFIGVMKIGYAIFNKDWQHAKDGMATFLRGLVEVVTTPITWFVKPITRGLITLFKGAPKIEENAGMVKLAKLGLKYVTEAEWARLSNQDMYRMLAVCNDLNRKFNKSHLRGQGSEIKIEEQFKYSAVRTEANQKQIDKGKLKEYFSLFVPKEDLNRGAALCTNRRLKA